MQRVPPYGDLRAGTWVRPGRLPPFAQPLVGGRIAARKLRHGGRSDGAQALPALREEQAAREGQQYEEQFAHSYYGESGLMQSYVFFGNVRAPERKSSQKGQNYPG